MLNNISIILTSVVVSALISGVFLLINEILRQKSEEKRIRIEIAIRLTKMRDEQIGEIIRKTNKKVLWPSSLNTFEKTFKAVEEIWNGKYIKSNKPPQETWC